MGVGIRYTGANGAVTDFTSASADEAFGRLSRISGYSRTNADMVAASLAGGWRERHSARSKANVRMLSGGVFGAQSNDLHTDAFGVAAGENQIGDISMTDGRIVATGRKRYLSADGNVVGYGPRVERTIGNLGSDDQRRKIDSISTNLGAMKKDVDELRRNVEGSVQDVVTGVDFAMGDDGLEITVTKAKAKVMDVGDESTTRKKIGERITVHENMNEEEHSEVIVLGRKKASPAAAKIAAKMD